MRQLLERASPEARQRYADAMLDALPEDVAPGDFDLGDILRDVARIVIGAPTLWRTVKPVSPIFTIALSLALPIVHAVVFYGCGGKYVGYRVGFLGRHVFWLLTRGMIEKCGFDFHSPLTALTFPFVQGSGRMALGYAFVLFVPLAVAERRIGHSRFAGLFLAFMAASVAAQTLFVATGLASGRLVGVEPVALGFFAYTAFAWPDLRIRDQFGLMSIYTGLMGLFMVVLSLTKVLGDFVSAGLGPVAACVALGAILGSRTRKSSRQASRAG